jgi:pimeloyl-ACP methyl ester carboxylesterase
MTHRFARILFLSFVSVFAMASAAYHHPTKYKNETPQYLTLPDGGRIAYHHTTPSNKERLSSQCKSQQTTAAPSPEPIRQRRKAAGVLFCNGFMSSMNGNKALALEEYCRTKLKIGFTRFDYRGHHGDDKDSFSSYGLSKWIEDASAMLEYCVKESEVGGPQIVVGSSMGAWIAIHLALLYPQHVAGVIGIAAAPDFTENIWQNFSSEQQKELEEKGRSLLPSQYSEEPYTISYHLISDARKWLLLSQKASLGDRMSSPPIIDLKCPVRLLHGQRDVDIPWEKSLQLASAISNQDVVLTLMKSGDHRMSTPQDVGMIFRVLDELLDAIMAKENRHV